MRTAIALACCTYVYRHDVADLFYGVGSFLWIICLGFAMAQDIREILK